MTVPQLTCQDRFPGVENGIFSSFRCDQWSHFSWDDFSAGGPAFLVSGVSFVTFQILGHTFHLVLETQLLIFLCVLDSLKFVSLLFFSLTGKTLINIGLVFQDLFLPLYICVIQTWNTSYTLKRKWYSLDSLSHLSQRAGFILSLWSLYL